MNDLLFVSVIHLKPTLTIQIKMKTLNEPDIGQTICVGVPHKTTK